jgi:hypothetical protein
MRTVRPIVPAGCSCNVSYHDCGYSILFYDCLIFRSNICRKCENNNRLAPWQRHCCVRPCFRQIQLMPDNRSILSSLECPILSELLGLNCTVVARSSLQWRIPVSCQHLARWRLRVFVWDSGIFCASSGSTRGRPLSRTPTCRPGIRWGFDYNFLA